MSIFIASVFIEQNGIFTCVVKISTTIDQERGILGDLQ